MRLLLITLLLAADPAFEAITDVPGLPRVLLIGDSISIGYTLPVRELLKDKANVHRIPANGGPTTNGVAKLDEWLGDNKWDVIHFNFGLHDLRIMEDGRRQVPPVEYERNLRTIVVRLNRTGARLIWCSTTPVPQGKLNPPRAPEDAPAYNFIARRVMQEAGVPINDLYGFVLPQLAELQRPANVHFSPEGSRVLAERVVQSILKELPRSEPRP